MLECGPGTHAESGECVLDQFQMRIDRQIVADGTAIRVLVFGIDGAPPSAELELGVSRQDAGAFRTADVVYDGRAFDATFVVCDVAMPGCVIGPVQLTVALKAAPATILGRIDAELIAPTQIGSFRPCESGGNILFVESDSFIYKGAVTVEQATFTPSGSNQQAVVEVVPTDPSQGMRWTFDISTAPLGTPLGTGVYLDTLQFGNFGRANLSIKSNSPFDYCQTTYEGAFQIHDILYTTSLERLSVSFRQWCGFNVVSGCIHLD